LKPYQPTALTNRAKFFNRDQLLTIEKAQQPPLPSNMSLSTAGSSDNLELGAGEPLPGEEQAGSSTHTLPTRKTSKTVRATQDEERLPFTFQEPREQPPQFAKAKKRTYSSKRSNGTEGCVEFHAFIQTVKISS
jgi:hypothetical protein